MTPDVGTWWMDANGRRWIVVDVAPEAGGGRAWLQVDGFDPRRPAMVPCWSWRAGEMRPWIDERPAEPADGPTAIIQRSEFVRPWIAERTA